jgi:hypothetical protein
MALWYILWSLGIFSSVFVCFTKKNLAALLHNPALCIKLVLYMHRGFYDVAVFDVFGFLSPLKNYERRWFKLINEVM